MKNCDLCKRELENTNDPFSLDCGGTCISCMACAGDPECVFYVLSSFKKGQQDTIRPQPEAYERMKVKYSEMCRYTFKTAKSVDLFCQPIDIKEAVDWYLYAYQRKESDIISITIERL